MIVSAHEEMNPSHRSTMEDCHVYYKADELDFGNPDMCMLGVYDGHGGRDIVEFLDVHLGKNISEEIRHNDKCGINEKLERAFIITDVESRMKNILYSGATVVICLIQKHIITKKSKKNNSTMDDNKRRYTIHTANCGDARAVLSTTTAGSGSISSNIRKKSKVGDDTSVPSKNTRSSCVYRLSTDDRADLPSEKERIETSGGSVIRNRVLGVLAVSRSLGDHQFKEFVIGRPHTHEMDVTLDAVEEEENETFIILACDGLWDVFQDEDAVAFVKKNVFDSSIHNHKDKQEDKKRDAAKVLIDEALRRGSTDNITCLVAWL